MESKILKVFYGLDCLPYKDKARTVHFPIVGNAFQGASNTTEIRFYYGNLGDTNTTWVGIAKLPNGRIGTKVLESHFDESEDEYYAAMPLGSFYTQYKGDLYISLQGYQGGVNVVYDNETEIYTITGTPTIQATGSVKIAINYGNQFIGSGEIDDVDLQAILAAIGSKVGAYGNTYITVVNNIATADLSNYENGHMFFSLSDYGFYQKDTSSQLGYVVVSGIVIDLSNYYTKAEVDSMVNTINSSIQAEHDDLYFVENS